MENLCNCGEFAALGVVIRNCYQHHFVKSGPKYLSEAKSVSKTASLQFHKTMLGFGVISCSDHFILFHFNETDYASFITCLNGAYSVAVTLHAHCSIFTLRSSPVGVPL